MKSRLKLFASAILVLSMFSSVVAFAENTDEALQEESIEESYAEAIEETEVVSEEALEQNNDIEDSEVTTEEEVSEEITSEETTSEETGSEEVVSEETDEDDTVEIEITFDELNKIMIERLKNGIELFDMSEPKGNLREHLDDTAKFVYDDLLRQSDILKDGVSQITITLPEELYVTPDPDDESKMWESLYYALHAFYYEQNEIYWYDYTKFIFGGSKSGTTGQLKAYKINLNSNLYQTYYISDYSKNYTEADCYSSQEELEQELQLVQNQIDEIIKAVDGLNRKEKIEYFNQWLVNKSEYNRYISNNEPNAEYITSRKRFKIASALVLGSTDTTSIYNPVCEGYARAFKVLCDRVDIPCTVAFNSVHMWNYVQMEDGKWYCMDVTYNDPVGLLQNFEENTKNLVPGSPQYNYYKEKFDNEIVKYSLVGTNTVINNETFNQNHIANAGFPTEGEENYDSYKYLTFQYPELSQTAFAGVYGDVDGDGLVTMEDASCILQEILKKSCNCDMTFSDMDGDGHYTANDASIVINKALS